MTTDELEEVDLGEIDLDKIQGRWRQLDRGDGGRDPWKVPQKPIPAHRLLRDVYRHYREFRQLFTDTGTHVLTHTYEWYDPDLSAEPDKKGNYPADITKPHKETVTLSLFDLTEGLNELAPRKRQAFYLNVVLDLLQKEVGAIMDITTVTVGQYVDQATMQLAKRQQFGGTE